MSVTSVEELFERVTALEESMRGGAVMDGALSRRLDEIDKLLGKPAFEAGYVTGMERRITAIENALHEGVTMIVTTQRERIEKLELLMSAVEDRLDALRAGEQKHDDAIERMGRVVELNRQQLIDQRQRCEGMAVRIDRSQGTLTDLLQRFEAWKTVGNEMGDLVNTQTEQLRLHSQMLEANGEIILAMKTMLEEIRNIILNKGDDMESQLPGLLSGR